MLTPLALAGLAAATPLVHEGDADWAEAEVQRSGGPQALSPRSWLALRRTPPGLATGADVELCEGPPVELAELSGALDAARADFDWGDFDAAAVAARAALALAPCLSEPATADTIARGWRLLGVSEFHADRLDQSDAAFLEVRGVSSDGAWDDSLPAQSLQRFRTVAPRVEVPILTVPLDMILMVDGQTRVAAPPGRRLLQWRTPIGLRGAWVDVSEDGSQLVVPEAIAARSLEEAVAAPESSGLRALLSRAWGPETQGWLVSSDAVYRVSDGEVARVARVSPQRGGGGALVDAGGRGGCGGHGGRGRGVRGGPGSDRAGPVRLRAVVRCDRRGRCARALRGQP